MTAAEVRDSKWVIAASETELHAAVTASLFLTAQTAARADDPVERSRNVCLLHALAAVKREEPVALLLSQTKELLEIRFPATGHVTSHWRDADNSLRFAVTGSPVVFTVPSEPTALSTVVTTAYDSNSRLLVLEASSDGFASVIERWDRPETAGACDAFEVHPEQISVLTEDAANAFYAQVFALNSVPPYTHGIPFRWSHSYCEAKAQAVRGVLRTIGVNVGKAWALAQRGNLLRITTTSRMSCEEQWAYHVAVVVRAIEGGSGGFWVFDPTVSLESGVLSFDAWKANFGPGLGHVQLQDL